MNSFPHDPVDPFGNASSGNSPRHRFAESMSPFWRSLHQALAHQKPKNWTGYRCEIQVGLDRSTGKYLVTAQFLDSLSNRAKNLESRNILDLVGCLHEAYRKFDVELEWRKVSLSHFWDETEKRWCDRTAWEYGQLILEPEAGDNSLN